MGSSFQGALIKTSPPERHNAAGPPTPTPLPLPPPHPRRSNDLQTVLFICKIAGRHGFRILYTPAPEGATACELTAVGPGWLFPLAHAQQASSGSGRRASRQQQQQRNTAHKHSTFFLSPRALKQEGKIICWLLLFSFYENVQRQESHVSWFHWFARMLIEVDAD